MPPHLPGMNDWHIDIAPRLTILRFPPSICWHQLLTLTHPPSLSLVQRVTGPVVTGDCSLVTTMSNTGASGASRGSWQSLTQLAIVTDGCDITRIRDIISDAVRYCLQTTSGPRAESWYRDRQLRHCDKTVIVTQKPTEQSYLHIRRVSQHIGDHSVIKEGIVTRDMEWHTSSSPVLTSPCPRAEGVTWQIAPVNRLWPQTITCLAPGPQRRWPLIGHQTQHNVMYSVSHSVSDTKWCLEFCRWKVSLDLDHLRAEAAH